MKIIQINASYKPAYIYGGPTMSVSKLSEELVKAGIDLTVFTTTANGKTELPITDSKEQLVDGVKVRYFKRLTKDHTHFSPALLWALRREIKGQKDKGRKRKNDSTKHKEVENNSGHSNFSTFEPSNNPAIEQSNNLTLPNAERQIPNAGLIIHIHAWWNLVSMLSALIAWFYKVPVVLSPRGMLTSYTRGNRNSLQKTILHWLIGKRLLAYSHIHATSEKEEKDVLQSYQVNGITIVPNFVRFPKTTTTPLTTAQTYQLLFLSRIEEKKGLELLFEALAGLPFDWKLQIAGSGDSNYIENLKQKAESLALTNNITWLGHVNDENKFKLLTENDLLVLTSYNENFANVVVESLSVGTPVLLSEEVGLATYVKENDLGWITPLIVDQIKSTLQQSYEQKVKRAEIRKTAPSLIQKDFDKKKLILSYINLYQKINAI